MVVVACADRDRRKIFSDRHLLLQFGGFDLLLKELILGKKWHSGTLRIENGKRLVLQFHVGRHNVEMVVVRQTAILTQQQFDDAEAVLEFRFLAFQIVSAKLNLQKVVAVNSSYAYHIINIFLKLFQHLVDRSKRQQLLFQRNRLPIVLLGIHFNLVF